MGTHGTDADRVVEVTFRLTNERYLFVGLTSSGACRTELVKMLPREEEYAEYFSVTGVDPDQVVEHAETTADVSPQILYRSETGGLFEFVVSESCPAVGLAELGAVPNRIVGADGEGTIVAEIPVVYDPSTVVEEFLGSHPSATLVTKREKETPLPMFTDRELQWALDDRLTDRQKKVLETAYEAGYYERPRDVTGEDIAARLEITPATFSQHIRAAERTLLSLLYENKTVR